MLIPAGGFFDFGNKMPLPIWTIVLKAADGGIHIEEVEAWDLAPESAVPAYPDYVLRTYAGEVARFPKAGVLGIYKGRRRQFNVTLEPVDDRKDE